MAKRQSRNIRCRHPKRTTQGLASDNIYKKRVDLDVDLGCGPCLWRNHDRTIQLVHYRFLRLGASHRADLPQANYLPEMQGGHKSAVERSARPTLQLGTFPYKLHQVRIEPQDSAHMNMARSFLIPCPLSTATSIGRSQTEATCRLQSTLGIQ